MSQIIYSDYNNSILNLITSILKYYNVETNHTSLEGLDERLRKKFEKLFNEKFSEDFLLLSKKKY